MDQETLDAIERIMRKQSEPLKRQLSDLYDHLGQLDRRLERTQERLRAVRDNPNFHQAPLDTLDLLLSAIYKGLDATEGDVQAIGQYLNLVDTQIQNVEGYLDAVREPLARMEQSLISLESHLAAIDAQLEEMEQSMPPDSGISG